MTYKCIFLICILYFGTFLISYRHIEIEGCVWLCMSMQKVFNISSNDSKYLGNNF